MYYQKVKEEERGAGTVGRGEDASWELERVSVEARDGRRGTAGELSDDAGMSSGPARSELKPALSLKTPKYSSKSDWEAFHAQFELLAVAGGWTVEAKALQLALCLEDDALSCLLLLSPGEKRDYGALVGALQRRFGQCVKPELLCSELSSRGRKPGEPLRVLANDIESLTRRAYAHMPPGVQSEPACRATSSSGPFSPRTCVSRYNCSIPVLCKRPWRWPWRGRSCGAWGAKERVTRR